MTAEPQTPTVTTAVLGNASQLPHGEENLSPLAQLRRMQRVLYSDAVAMDTDKRLRPQIACAWERLEGRKAVLSGKPGSLTARVEVEKPSRRQRRTERVEPVDGPHDTPEAPKCT